jgi:prolipoprotein diacylglyceryltransferase
MNSWKKPGFMFGSFLIIIFGSRFFIEYIKEGQTARDFELLINTGQMLSIPFIIAGILLIYRSQKNQETT